MRTFELFLSTKLDAAKPTLRWSTGFGFPFDQIATKLVDWIMRKEVKKFLGRPTDGLRVSLSDFSDIAISLGLNYGYVETDARTDTFLVGLGLGEEG